MPSLGTDPAQSRCLRASVPRRQRRQYNAPMAVNRKPPYAELTPDCVLDALSSIGLSGDGRLLSLNSYENRVYQVWLDDGAPTGGLPGPPAWGGPQCYRPRRV